MDELINEDFAAMPEPGADNGITQEPAAHQITESYPQSEAAPKAQSAFDYNAIKKVIDDHFANLISVVRFVKEKDANVLALSKQMQAYRDGFEQTLFKRIALDIIGYREDCRKSLETLTPGSVNAERAGKYIDYLSQDLTDMLSNNGVEQSGDGTYTYNGKPMTGEIERITFRDLPPQQQFELPQTEVADEAGLIEYLKSCEQVVTAAVKYNATLDSVLADYINASKVYERSLSQMLLFPVFRKIISLCDSIAADKAEEPITDENAVDVYGDVLRNVIGGCRAVLEMCNVIIDDEVPQLTDYDPRRHRSLKLVMTDDPELNGKIARRSTDCYIMDEKVIYPAKVEIYKLK